MPRFKYSKNGVGNLRLPPTLSFKNAKFIDFDAYLSLFDWNFSGNVLYIDCRQCKSANYQSLSLLILYIWYLKKKDCYIKMNFSKASDSFKRMWERLGGFGCYNVLNDKSQNFIFKYDKPLFAIRDQSKDIPHALDTILQYSQNIDMDLISGQEDTLRYIISELLYNTMEHGYNPEIPSLLQFNWYRDKGQLSFILADLGIGIKTHLEKTYPPFSSDMTAIEYAIKPEISGTFGINTGVYQAKNNAGMGLYLSSNIGKRLEADMYIVSGNGLLHISPTDITSKTLRNKWPGTFIYMTIGFDKLKSFNIHNELDELRAKAKIEVTERENAPMAKEKYIDMNNYFGTRCEVKEEAINIRDRYIIPALDANQTVVLDFSNTNFATHSFLVALLATPIQKLGLLSYKLIKIQGANSTIRATLDFIFDSYTS